MIGTEAEKSTAFDQNTPSRLKIAFIGGAYDSAVGRAHRVAVEMDQRFELVAGCFSREQEKSYDSALKYGIDPSRAYSDLNTLLNEEAGKLDAVVILTPQDQHGSQVVSILNAAIPVICEKALVTSSCEAAEIRKCLVQRKGFLAVTYNYTGYPMVRELKHMVESGILGQIQQLHIEMPQEGFARMSPDGTPIVPQEWRLRGKLCPHSFSRLGGALAYDVPLSYRSIP